MRPELIPMTGKQQVFCKANLAIQDKLTWWRTIKESELEIESAQFGMLLEN